MFLAPMIGAALPSAVAAATLAAGKAIGAGVGQGAVKIVGNGINAIGEFLDGDGNASVSPNAAQQAFIQQQQMMQQRR